MILRALCFAILAVTLQAAHVEVDSARVYYETGGKGDPAIVLIHGWSCDLTFWRLQRPALEKEFRVLAVDLPGHGQSDKPHVEYDARLFARAVLAAMKHAGIDRAVLVGHSMGVMIARQVIEQDPSRVTALVSVDGAVFPPSMGAALRSLAAKMAGPGGQEFRAGFIKSMFTSATPEPIRDELLKKMIATPEHVAISAFEHTVGGDVWSAAPTNIPVLLYMQKRPQPQAREYPKQVMTNIVDLHEWSDVSHFLHMERPDEFNAILVKFARSYKK